MSEGGDAAGARDGASRTEGAGDEVEGRTSDSRAIHEELLIHPDDEPEPGEENPFGVPGAPVSKHSPFYVGFWGGLGVLVAIFSGMAFQRIASVLILVIVSAFLAVGFNRVVEILIHRGLRREWAVLVVSVGVLGMLTLFVV